MEMSIVFQSLLPAIVESSRPMRSIIHVNNCSKTELIVLKKMWKTGFSMDVSLTDDLSAHLRFKHFRMKIHKFNV